MRAPMAANEPWMTLRRDYDGLPAPRSRNPAKERYIVRADGERAGLLILDMTGPFPGYIQSICVAPDARGRGIGIARDRVGGGADLPRQPERVHLRVVVQPRCAAPVRATRASKPSARSRASSSTSTTSLLLRKTPWTGCELVSLPRI